MPPRQDEKKMVIAAHGRRPSTPASSPASRPSLFELPKDISFLHIQQPMLPSKPSRAEDAVRQRLASSLDRATERAESLRERMERENTECQCPVVHEACRSALADETSRVLGQASLLLLEEDNKDVDRTTKNKRISVALISALQYLDTLESAMAFSSRGRLEAGLLSVLDSVATKCKDDYLDVVDSLNVCVSSWKAPSLAFDFRVGSPALLSVPAQQPPSLPLELEVRPVIEYTADELIRAAPRLEAEAFVVTVKKCSHEVREYGTRDGITGVAMVQVHIAPLAESKTKQEVVWGVHDDVEPVRVKEVRATQQNAYPTKFRINFDMFTSTAYGEKGVTLTLALETCQTMDGKVPKVQIELVVDP